ncbi:PREDICTED: solute carrier family 22 member 3-like [Papilio polytes]|uniref:solute carrier family 22 member 3-like n=1 Tax=Papilio polytes TaxID=76194 RepID=UPI00067626BB|nr:PREDICTED: solute carrier family 22 member 3-like [Papilio polytes]
MPGKNKREIDVEHTMEKFGLYQVVQYFLICLPPMFITMYNVNYIFVVGEVNYRCRIPECDTSTGYPEYKPSWWPDKHIDRCKKPKFTGGACTKQSFSDDLEECTDWVYETNETVITELDLACHPWKSNMIGAVHNVGLSIAWLASGYLADRFGRKPTLILCGIFGGIGIFKVFTTSYIVYIILEFLEGTIGGGTYTSAMVLMIEIGGVDNRVLAGVIFSYAVYLGETLFALVAMFLPYWKTLVLIIYSPVITFVLLFFLIKESPRWQLLVNETDKAKHSLLHIAKVNKININKDKLLNMSPENLRKEFKMDTYQKRESFGAVVRSSEMRKRTLVAGFCKFTSGFVYYGLMVNSVFLPGNKYTNFMLATVMSYPGEFMSLYLMNKYGRKFPLIYGFLLCGVLCSACGAVPEEYKDVKVVLFLLGKLIVSVCFTGVITYTMELFPTSVRGTMLGVCSVCAGIGSVLAPLTPILNEVSIILPPLIFGATALVSGVLLTRTPETKGAPLMDTIEQLDRTYGQRSSTRR